MPTLTDFSLTLLVVLTSELPWIGMFFGPLVHTFVTMLTIQLVLPGNLVASLMKKLAEGFANERERLEKQWDRGDNVSTEDLRIALQRYRSFFDRLLKI